MSSPDSRALRAYMWIVVACSAPLVGYAAREAFGAADPGADGRRTLIIVVFCAVLVFGELFPIPVARGLEAGDEVTVSSTFGFGLLLIAPVLIAVLAQALALALDAAVRPHRRRLGRLLFNIAQYAIAFICARAVYAWVAGQPFTPNPDDNLSLLACAAAGLVFLVVNNSLVGVAVSMSVQMHLGRVLIDDLRWQITTSAPLLGLGPLAVHAMYWTPACIVLLLMPIVSLHYTGTLAMRREQQALRDTLTGLANRAMLHRATEEALSKSFGATAMLLLDLDHFKDINDTLGHAVGDEMLCTVADRLTDVFGPHDLVVRLGGDEFVVLLRNVAGVDSVTDLARRVCGAVRAPVVLNGVTLSVGCSVGIAFATDEDGTTSELLRHADIALYDAKVTRGDVALYRKENDRHSTARLGLQADLRMALENPDDTQLWVAFQPQLDVASGRVESVESLIRWDHPERGPIDTETFVSIAESHSLIDLILARVLDASLAALVRWDRSGVRLRVSVNLSAGQLHDASLPGTVADYLERYGVAADRLVLEVTESRLVSDPERAANTVAELHALGVQISIDDFGTGYSSLAYLMRLAVDEIKIDRTFVEEMARSGDSAIVRSTIDLGHQLGLRVVAEGVEESAIADRLTEMGCDVLQGFHVGVPARAARLFLDGTRGTPSLVPAALAS